MNTVLFLFWVIYPALVIFGTNYLNKRFKLYERFKVKSVDIATFFLILGLHQLTQLVFELSVLPFYMIALFLLGISVALFQGFFYEEIHYGRFFKMYWRLAFLYTFGLYLFIIVYSIVEKLN